MRQYQWLVAMLFGCSLPYVAAKPLESREDGSRRARPAWATVVKVDKNKELVVVRLRTGARDRKTFSLNNVYTTDGIKVSRKAAMRRLEVGSDVLISRTRGAISTSHLEEIDGATLVLVEKKRARPRATAPKSGTAGRSGKKSKPTNSTSERPKVKPVPKQ